MTIDAEHDITTIRLPQTGLHVPDRSLSLTAYKQLKTSDGVAFTANLRVRNKRVGLIENAGTGGMTFFHATEPRVWGETQIEAYAARCRTEEGKPVTVEDLLNELVEEHEAGRWVASCVRKKQVPLRKMGVPWLNDGDQPDPDFGPYPHEMLAARQPSTAEHANLLAKELLRKYPTGAHSWWQMWNGQGWHDISPRPAYLPKDLYA